MARTIVFAIPNREYALRLAEYLRETEPGWETSAFTYEHALRIRLQEPGRIDVLLGPAEWLENPGLSLSGVGVAAAWSEERPESAEGERPRVALYQPLPGVAADIRSLMGDAGTASVENCKLLTVYSASGGAGKTATALNLVKLAGERGQRVLYLNLEPLNATFRLFGPGEPDNFSRLLYVLQTEPHRFGDQVRQSVRRHACLRADFLDAPEHPAERAAMTPELLESLIGGLRQTGLHDLIVADADSGVSAWHAKLIGLSDRVAWLVPDDWQARAKAERLAAYWRDEWPDGFARISFIRSQVQGESFGRWNLPWQPSGTLPYVPQWKAMEDPGGIFGSAAFCGALESLLDERGLAPGGKGAGHDGKRARDPVRSR